MMLRLVLSVKQSESNLIYKKSGGVDEMRTLDEILLFSFFSLPPDRTQPDHKNIFPQRIPL